MNYILVVLFNWIVKDSFWGVECLLLVWVYVCYSLSLCNMLFVGFELEGQSYCINGVFEMLNN